ncbi:hypothetical protein KEF29_04875 [Streptomyces tuirus]|uniref:MotA/TolQ/ExbB proton channel domain-containing protein n=1 Tax=Streptomyces tuirus TaxID=68278 RepID=A0A941FF71_9ACTN|nr:hypothetical protein [Streptomyces tuirus]
MILLGFLLAAGAAAFGAVAVVDTFTGGPECAVEILGNQIATLSMLGIFLSGVVLALIFCLGPVMTASGRKQRQRVRELLASAPTASREDGAATGSPAAWAARFRPLTDPRRGDLPGLGNLLSPSRQPFVADVSGPAGRRCSSSCRVGGNGGDCGHEEAAAV